MTVRQATLRDLGGVTATIAAAFAIDPVWEVALRRADGSVGHHAAYWRIFVDAAHDQGGVWLIEDGAAVSIWIPPGGSELSDGAAAVLEEFNEAALGDLGAREMTELYERFESTHPAGPSHAYLSLLATHPDHRGRGIGQGMLGADLARWDDLGVPGYLESTNPGNDHRYERAGFRRVGGFRAVRDDAPITTMWRDVGGSGRPDDASSG